MSLSSQIASALSQVGDQESFFKTLLSDTLEWPTGEVDQVAEIAYGWSAEDLSASELDKSLVDGNVWQLQRVEKGQPWGIFILEFKNPDALSPRRGMAGVLRKVLRGLVASRRRDPKLPSWKREHLLFICTSAWETFRFAYFRTKPDEPQTARLTTFGWAPGTSNRTVCEFNLPALKWPDDPSDARGWVASWAQAFDKEPLTKDFFMRFDDALEAIKADLEQYQDKLSSAEAYTQSQLLLERLIFLYFLQNRGWLNQDKRYLPSRLADYFDKPEAFTYYSAFLDRLFWTLSSPPGAGGDRFPGIPFLNGGLFDDDEFRQPPETRKTNPPLKVRNRTMKYVFDELLEAFNFTVTEDTPLTQEVAVDPEMLGKVFESIVLHAEAADPDAVAPDKRKATGSYYTPRIVVHFICREVLYQYLLNHLPGDGWGPRLRTLLAIDAIDGIDEQAKEILRKNLTPKQAVPIRDIVVSLKCCDPAVGSGAFPVGLLHELVNLRRLLTTAANGYVDPVRQAGSSWLHETKEDIVQNCLFGVDIQQQAIEICRLRLWLSLVVDYDLGLDPFTAEKSQFGKAIERISQLPNLEMNFHRGDSLHDHICGVPIMILPDRASRHAEEFQAIAKLGQDLHHAKRAERKKKLRLQIVGKRLDLSQRIVQEEIDALRRDDSALDTLFGLSESAAEKRKRIAGEIEKLEEARVKVSKDREELEKLSTREFDRQFYPKLRKLEGADFDSPFNFAWAIDFPSIFGDSGRRGFDIIVGNPPFVTARNPVKRELWRKRWPRVCYGKYHMLCPFFELSFGLLKSKGQLGFIVSNGFAKREFGKPLVEDFFSELDIRKIVDCSGLLFPGHGTPTCLVFGANQKPGQGSTIRNIAILPGGGDLRTPPEESPLWQSIEAHHALALSAGENAPLSREEAKQGFRKVYEDFRVAIGDCDRARMLRHPCIWGFFDWSLFEDLERADSRLASYLGDDIGFDVIFGARELYDNPTSLWRVWRVPQEHLIPFAEGDTLRNYSADSRLICLFPYDKQLKPVLPDRIKQNLGHWRGVLEDRPQLGGLSQVDFGLEWFEYYRFTKRGQTPGLALAEIATHAHVVFNDQPKVFTQTAPMVKLVPGASHESYQLSAGWLNSSTALFWLKQVCFNKGAGEDEERDRFVYAGNKIQQLPVPAMVAEALERKRNAFGEPLTQLSQACWERGQRMSALALRKLFEKAGEAYQEWNNSLPGYSSPSPEFDGPFKSSVALREMFRKAQTIRDRLRAEMIALQEEMDWLVYAAYGLLRQDHQIVLMLPPSEPSGESSVIDRRYCEPLDRDGRPFRLWARAEGDYAKAVTLIPSDWPVWRKKLWEARLRVICENEHIRRIEQPVYKRRWDEQWKVANQWRYGPVAYAAEFIDAFEWWLREKAEWWLEHKKSGGPVELDEWAAALWKDPRVQAAWEVALENYVLLDGQADSETPSIPRQTAAAVGTARPDAPLVNDEPGALTLPGMEAVREPRQQSLRATASGAPSSFSEFRSEFKRIVDEETVPEGFAFGVSYEDLERKLKKAVPAKLTKVRGKLNVPRERFHLRNKSQYLWAGLQFGNH